MNAASRHPSSGRTRAVEAVQHARHDAHAVALSESYPARSRPARTSGPLGNGFRVFALVSRNDGEKVYRMVERFALELGLSSVGELLAMTTGELKKLSERR